MTRRQSNNQWSGGIAPHLAQKIPSAKSYRLDFLVSRRHPPIDYILKAPNINSEYYLSLLVQLKDISKEKRLGSSPR